MNLLAVGAERHETILEHLPSSFLLLDNGELIDRLEIPRRRKVTHFDFKIHSLDILKDITYEKATNLVEVIEAAFPAGANTLTKQDSAVVLLEALLDTPKSLDRLLTPPKKTDSNGHVAAYRKIQRLLLSPILNHVLTNSTNFSLKGILLARLPLTLPRFDRFILGNLLVSLYPGQVVIPDFGFYGCELHKTLLDQNRLMAGLNYLDETPLTNDLLRIPTKVARRTTAKDAETLADYSGYARTTGTYQEIVKGYIKS